MMKTKEEIQEALSESFRVLREKKNLSKAKIADLAYMDAKTWSRYESGETSPCVADFIQIYSLLGEDALSTVLSIIYPDTYKDVTSKSDTKKLRECAAHYFQNVASDKTVREWEFIVCGNHGSNIEPQMQLFTAINHLPLEYRIVIANMVLTLWKISEANGELIKTDHVMPDVRMIEDGVKKALESVERGSSAYTTSMK